MSQIDEIDRLTKIVDGLTLLTKADAGQVALHLEPLQLDELVRESFADANILAHPAGIRVSLSDCQETAIQGDRHRLRQLLLNLTDNAVKYNNPGGAVAISLRRAGAAAELRIANTGPGLPAELQPRVFERFFRGDASHNREVEGCGLGLSIAQWIVHAHGGTIQFASQPGQLTTVTVRLPLAAPPFVASRLKGELGFLEPPPKAKTRPKLWCSLKRYTPALRSGNADVFILAAPAGRVEKKVLGRQEKPKIIP